MRSPEMGTARLESGAPPAVGATTAAAFAFLLLWASAAWPQSAPAPARAKEWERLASTVGINELAISPHGARVAFVARREGARGQLFVLEWRRGGAPVRVVPGGAGTHSEGAPAWSPDSGRLAFVSDASQSGQNQVWVAGADGSHPKRLTGVTGYVARPHWSPDGTSIAFLHIEGGRGGGPLGASGPRTGVIEETIRNQRVGVAEVKSGKVRLVSPPGLHVFDYDWSPDGRSLAVTAAPGPGDNNWWVAQLYVVDVAAGNVRPLYRPRWQIAIPRWSPDGSRIAFIEGLMSDEGVHGGDLCTVPAGGGPATNHTSGRATSPSWERWVSPSRILFAEFEGGGSALSTLDLASGAIASAWRGPEEVTAGGSTTSFAVADDGSTSALVRQGFCPAARGVGGHDRRVDAGDTLQRGAARGVGRRGEPALEERRPRRAGVARSSEGRQARRALPVGGGGPRRAVEHRDLHVARELDRRRRPDDAGGFRPHAEPARELRPG